jgi:hypothetical protein
MVQSQRVDFVGIGDSNQIHSGDGWDHGFQYALSTLGYPAYATGLVSQNEGSGSGSGQGYGYNRSGSLMGATTGADANLQKYYDVGSGALQPAYATYVADGSSVANNVACGLFLTPATADILDVTAALKFDIHYGTFTTGTGSFRPSSRLEVSPFTTLASSTAISTNAGAFGMQTATLTLSADASRSGKNISGKPILTGTTGITGPFFHTYYRWRNPGRTTGWAYGTLDYRGGQSMRTVAYDLQQASDDTLTHYFSILRNDQGGTSKVIVICVNEGLNDRNETLTSVGPGAVTDGDSPEAYVDNFTALQQRIEAIWTLNGWDQSELWWLVFPSHPVSDPDDSELISYRAAIQTYLSANLPQSLYVDLTTLTNYAELTANSWYYSDGTNNHLTKAGYEQLSLRVLRAAN